jgi:hypothetical protein
MMLPTLLHAAHDVLPLLPLPLPSHRSFLERLAAHAADHGPVQPPGTPGTATDSSSQTSSSSSSSSRPSSSQAPIKSLADVPVYVAPPKQHQQYDADSSRQQQQQAVHELVGYITVHMDSPAAEVYRTIQVGWMYVSQLAQQRMPCSRRVNSQVLQVTSCICSSPVPSAARLSSR